MGCGALRGQFDSSTDSLYTPSRFFFSYFLFMKNLTLKLAGLAIGVTLIGSNGAFANDLDQVPDDSNDIPPVVTENTNQTVED